MNRALSSQSRIQTTTKRQTLNERAARTRTLIQTGGLLKLSGLFTVCEIEEGDDLQFDITSRDKAALLLGILMEAMDKISDPPDTRLLECWRESGTRLLKQRAAQNVYQKLKRRP
jgi:ATP-dependent DNA ligase